MLVRSFVAFAAFVRFVVKLSNPTTHITTIVLGAAGRQLSNTPIETGRDLAVHIAAHTCSLKLTAQGHDV
jgi:hypothetical protein